MLIVLLLDWLLYIPLHCLLYVARWFHAYMGQLTVTEVKNSWMFTATPPYVFVVWCLSIMTMLILPKFVRSHHRRVQTGSGGHLASYPMGNGPFSWGVNRAGREADYSLLSSAGVRNAWSYTFAPQYAFMARCSVEEKEHRENFYWNIGDEYELDMQMEGGGHMEIEL
jgi:hypothetical protein